MTESTPDVDKDYEALNSVITNPKKAPNNKAFDWHLKWRGKGTLLRWFTADWKHHSFLPEILNATFKILLKNIDWC